MKNVTIIIPIIPMQTDEEKKFFKSAIDSVPVNYPIVIVGSDDAMKSIEDIKTNTNTEKLINNGNTKLPGQINLAVKNIKTKFFSVLEFDDVFTQNWFVNFDKYNQSFNEEVSIFLPLTEVLDFETSGIIGYANEAFWASSFSEEIGYMDINSLQDYLNINTHGGIINTEDFKSVGMLKESMSMFYWYEFLLRALYKGKKVYIIPKIGYVHTINRQKNEENISRDEFEWWLELANKEYFFTQDRNKTYKGV